MNRTHPFTLIELLVVVAILVLLASLIQPHLRSAIEMSRRVECANRQKQTYVGLSIYCNNYYEWCPSGKEYGGFRNSVYPTYGSLGNFRIEHLDTAVVIDGSNYASMRKGDDLTESVRKNSLMFCPSVDMRKDSGTWRWRSYHADSWGGNPTGPWVDLPSSKWRTFLYDSYSQLLVGAGVFGLDGYPNQNASFQQFGSSRLSRMSKLNGRSPAIITEYCTSYTDDLWRNPHRMEGMNVTDHTGAVRWDPTLVWASNYYYPSSKYIVATEGNGNPIVDGEFLNSTSAQAVALRATLGYR